LQNDGKTHYIILDEVQLVDNFVEVLLSLTHSRQLEVYVSGSNSRFLSSDVVTEFRGRGEEIRVWPLSFAEYYAALGGDKQSAWKDYYTFGGLPQVLLFNNEKKKKEYLHNLYELTYLRDIIERNHLRSEAGLRQLIQILASGIGSSTNPGRISNTFLSRENLSIGRNTICDYLAHLKDAFLLEEALRYDVKGRKYIGTETKYYFLDPGLRNVILNFRQLEETHLMENIIYNELRRRGCSVDVGLVEAWGKDKNGTSMRRNLEVDFVVNDSDARYYIQAALTIGNEEKRAQETASFRQINDSFKRIIIVKDDIAPYYDDNGYLMLGLFDFLLKPDSLTAK
jgi:predicted AAA+ superfamily ATPase